MRNAGPVSSAIGLGAHCAWGFRAELHRFCVTPVRSAQCAALRCRDARTGAQIGEPMEGHGDYVLLVDWSPCGRQIVSGSDDGTLRRWDACTGVPVGVPMRGHGN